MSHYSYFLQKSKQSLDFSSRVSKCLLNAMTIMSCILTDKLQAILRSEVVKGLRDLAPNSLLNFLSHQFPYLLPSSPLHPSSQHTYTHTHTLTHAHTPTLPHTLIHNHTYSYTHMHTHAHTHTHTHTSLFDIPCSGQAFSFIATDLNSSHLSYLQCHTYSVLLTSVQKHTHSSTTNVILILWGWLLRAPFPKCNFNCFCFIFPHSCPSCQTSHFLPRPLVLCVCLQGCESITITRSLKNGNHVTSHFGCLQCGEDNGISVNTLGIVGEQQRNCLNSQLIHLKRNVRLLVLLSYIDCTFT